MPQPGPDPFEGFIEDLFPNDSDSDEDIDTI
jgi:hypothetical protein